MIDRLPSNDEIEREMMYLVNLGFLDMGVTDEGDILWIPTEAGMKVLGMTPESVVV